MIFFCDIGSILSECTNLELKDGQTHICARANLHASGIEKKKRTNWGGNEREK